MSIQQTFMHFTLTCMHSTSFYYTVALGYALKGNFVQCKCLYFIYIYKHSLHRNMDF